MAWRVKAVGMLKRDIVLAVFLLPFFVLYLEHALSAMFFPGELCYAEGFILNSAKILSAGGAIYPRITPTQTNISVYPPVYYIMLAFLVKLFGLSFAFGRAISIVAAVLVSFIIFLLVEDYTKCKWAAVVASIAFLLSPSTYYFSVFAISDCVALFFPLPVFICF